MSDDASLAPRRLGLHPGCHARFDTQSELTGPRIWGWLGLSDRRSILIIEFIRIADSGILRRISLIHDSQYPDARRRGLALDIRATREATRPRTRSPIDY
jgi:hypothetical protein